MSQTITSVYPVFQDLDGEPLELGYLYIGTAGLDAFSNQITVYWDAALTDAATQPIRTKGGYPNNAGAYAAIYTGANDYSIDIRDSNNVAVTSSQNRVKTGIGSLQNSYENGAEIITDATEGSVIIQRGSASDTDAVFQIENGAGTVVLNVRADNKVGFGTGTATPLGTVNIRTAASGASAATASADDLVVENSAAAGISILSGNTSTAGILFGDDGAGNRGGIVYANVSDALFLSTAATNAVMIDSSQNMGIGEVAAPLGKLHVKTADSGAASVSTSGDEFVVEGSGNSGLSILSGLASSGSIYFGDSAGNAQGVLSYDHNLDTLSLSVAASIAITVDSTGQLGVGETTPLGKLHVKSADSGASGVTASADELVVEGSGACGISILSGIASTGGILFGDSAAGNSGGVTYAHATDGLFLSTSATNAVLIDSSQNVGIGELVTPLGKLHVKTSDAGAFTPDTNADEGIFESNGNCGIMIISGGASLSQIQMGDAAAPANGGIYYDNASDYMGVSTAGTEKVRVTSGGNVGVGETVPLGKMHIKSADAGAVTIDPDADELVIEGSGNAGISIIAGASSNSAIYLGDAADPNQCILQNVNSVGQFQIWTQDTVSMAIGPAAIVPGVDNTSTAGTGAFRYSELFSVNATINTSDEREKTLVDLDDAVLDVIDRINIVTFKWNDSVDKNGLDGARIHSGVLAQDIKRGFEAANLDPSKYSLFCYDEWEETLDGEGNVLSEAGNRYGVRYEELYALKIACLDRRISNLENV